MKRILILIVCMAGVTAFGQVVRPLSYTTISKLTVDTLSAGHYAGGTWIGTVVAGQYGGTGVANTGKTITLGGNFTTSGAHTTTFTTTNNTALTLPTTGTVATLAGAEAFTNKTSINKVKLTAPTNSAELALSDASKLALVGGDTLTLTTSANTSITLPTSGKLMSETSVDSVTAVKKFFGENVYYQAIATVTDTTTLSVFGYHTVVADATSSAILITLPNAALCEGKVYEIKCINADAEVKVISAGGNIDGTAAATGFTMALWDAKRLISNGTLWLLL